MAARFAVATGNWTGAIWAATSGGAAGSAAVPTNADDATINKNVTVTIDDAPVNTVVTHPARAVQTVERDPENLEVTRAVTVYEETDAVRSMRRWA